MTKTKLIGYGIGLLLIAWLVWYWLSGELFRPHRITTVDLTVVFPDGSPASNAHFDFTQSGGRVIIPIPFASMGTWQVESKFSGTADSNGHCRITFFDQFCQLDRVTIDAKEVRVVANKEIRYGDTIVLNSSLPLWHASPRPYPHQMVVSRPE